MDCIGDIVILTDYQGKINGDIAIDSEAGKGTTFTINIPVVEE